MIGYKIAKHGDTRVVVTLEIPADALTNMDRASVAVRETAKYRANKAKVLQIEDSEGKTYETATSFNYSEKSLEYTVGGWIEEPSYNMNPEEICAEGIHYFLTRHVAESYGLESIQNGLFLQWHDNGQKWVEATYVAGKLHGLYQRWHANGQKLEEVTFVEDKRHGLYQLWHANGQKWAEVTYVEGKRHGLYPLWYANGQKLEKVTFVEDKRHGLYQSWHVNGQKWVEATYVAGKRHGLYQRWYANGQKLEEVTFVEDKRHGLYQLWHANGQKWEEVAY